MYRCVLTDGDVRRAVRLEEAVDVLPHLGHPLDDALQLRVTAGRHAPGALSAPIALQLAVQQLAAQVAPQEALHRLHVVGAQHPAEVVVQLQVGGGARRLVHRADDERAAVNANGTVRNRYEVR